MKSGGARESHRIARSCVVSALLLTALAACGGTEPQPDFVVRSAAIVLRSDAPFTQHGDLPERIESTIEAALEYWGGDWSHLSGRTITFEGTRYVQCGSSTSAIGCFDGDLRVSTRDIAFTYQCVEQTVLVHEIGHAVIGDPNHTDPRWMDFSSLEQKLQGRTGYLADGQEQCQIFVSVWRHPPAQ